MRDEEAKLKRRYDDTCQRWFSHLNANGCGHPDAARINAEYMEAKRALSEARVREALDRYAAFGVHPGEVVSVVDCAGAPVRLALFVGVRAPYTHPVEILRRVLKDGTVTEQEDLGPFGLGYSLRPADALRAPQETASP